MKYLNQFCWCGTVHEFLNLDCENWLREMEKNYSNVTPYKLTDSQRRAWRNSFPVLTHSLRELGADYESLHLVFEYCLPYRTPKQDEEISDTHTIRADCVVVSEKQVVVLEFKDRKQVVKWHAHSARRYRNRLQDLHDASIGKGKWSILVPTLMTDLQEGVLRRLTACSPNRLADELRKRFGEKPLQVASISAWCGSTYSRH